LVRINKLLITIFFNELQRSKLTYFTKKIQEGISVIIFIHKMVFFL